MKMEDVVVEIVIALLKNYCPYYIYFQMDLTNYYHYRNLTMTRVVKTFDLEAKAMMMSCAMNVNSFESTVKKLYAN